MLGKLNDTSYDIQRKWVRFLLERVGHNNLPRLLKYYIQIGWISDQAAERLLEIANLEKRYKGPSWTLSAEEQRISRLFIEKLSGKDIDDYLLTVPVPEKARVIKKKIEIRPLENMHPIEKKKMEMKLHRSEVTIINLEQELEEKYSEIQKLKERVHELETELEKKEEEIMRHDIFRNILDDNITLRNIRYSFRKKMD